MLIGTLAHPSCLLGDSQPLDCMKTYEGFYGNPDPLDKRGWTLQERLLVTRLVNYSTSELQWVCKTGFRCEGGHQDSPQHNISIHAVTRRSEAYAFWQDTVKKCSYRNLSYAKDKLPALADVASKIAEATGDENLAGIWKGNLAWDR